MKKICCLLVLCFGLFVLFGQAEAKAPKFPIGYALDFQKITDQKMQYIKSLGINYIELSGIGALLDKNLQSTQVDPSWTSKIKEVAAILKRNKVKVWSIHMPFSLHLDISRVDEEGRLHVMEAQRNVLQVLKPVKAEIILFHPSFYLRLNERSERKAQLQKSVAYLNKEVKAIGSNMVVENMLGPSLTVNGRERPLMRSVEECLELFQGFPKDVGLAVDFCHIAEPQHLLASFGSRVKTLHVSNGDGTAEYHYLPCDTRGKNDWNSIFATLEKIKYKGVYMHECKYNDEKEIVDCYQHLWDAYQTSLTIKK
ncbi:sugar phosphate isomerase/epimerase family protein [Sphingobacterium sp. UBA6645]|uniref:sugar phosphate isomerase/epimerase family protein n=1 Tax=Sphingobacterium sp. UBA6645 TaxID=1947511 RepID=UPI0025D45159|nr:TIM barrel protein [Sphingobacterium sp. UBA6645]